MRRLYRRLAFVYLASALLFVLLFAVSLYIRGREEKGYYLYQLLGGVDGNLDEAQEAYDDAVRRLCDTYATHAREAAYILAREGEVEVPALETLRELLDVGAVSLLDDGGRIILSTKESLQGTKEEDSVMEQIREAPAKSAAAVRVDEPDFWEQPAYLYVVVPAESAQFAAVRIDGDMSRLGLTSGAQRVRATLGQATTEYGTSIFAAGKARGLIIGITENNRQDIEIAQVEEGQEMVDFMDALPEGKPVVLRINGAWQSVVVRERHDMYLAAFTGMDQVMADVFATFVIAAGAAAVISAVTIFVVRRYIRRFMFSRFEQVQEGIRRVLQGGEIQEEEKSALPELRPLLEMISRLEQGYADKAAGMDRMAGELTDARQEAALDRLTGLYNRNGFERQAEAFLEKSEEEGVLLLFDLDHFKLVNDMEGHPAGDRLLVQFARCLSGAFRREDVVGRLGGDEFAVLLTRRLSAGTLEEKLRGLFREIRSSMGESYGKYQVSASAGAVPVDGSLRDYGELYQCADTALYIAKYMGRDRYYINEQKIRCMRRECTGCRADCPRSRILRGKGE